MRFAEIQAVLNDLPATFRRPGHPYTQLIDAQTLALATATTGWDGLAAQCATLQQALDGWIDVWGLLFGVPRNSSEGNVPYAFRIAATVTAVVGTLPALQLWMALFMPGGTVTDNSITGSPPRGTGKLGYTLLFPSYAMTADIAAFVLSLARIRPAGVPFVVQQGGSGVFLGTINFLSEGQMPGSYLVDSNIGSVLGLPAWTNNSPPLLPSLLLTGSSIGSTPPGFVAGTSPSPRSTTPTVAPGGFGIGISQIGIGGIGD